MATVHTILSTSPTPALLIAVVTYLSVSAVSVGSVVAAVKGKVPHHELSLVISVASQMNWIRILFQTVPILPAVEQVRMPPSSKVLAADPLLRGRAVRLGGWRVLAVVVALVADGPPIALGLLGVVAAHVDGVKHLRVAILIIRADKVSRLTARNTVPVFSAIELIRKVAVTDSSAVYLVVRRGAVLGGAGRGGRRGTMDRVITGPVSAVHIMGVGAPVVGLVILLIIGAGLMGHTSLVTPIELVAGLRVRHGHKVIGAAN